LLKLINSEVINTKPNIENNIKLNKILNNGILNKVYPGVVAFAGNLDGTYEFSTSLGNYEYENDNEIIDNKKVTINSKFDMASVSKVIATTTSLALLYQYEYINLDTKISSILGFEYNQGGKDNITIRNCLLHNSGYQPDPSPWYWDKSYGCPNTNKTIVDEDFSCLNDIYNSLFLEQVQQPPGTLYVYSDLSFITLQYVIGKTVLENNLISKNTIFLNNCIENMNSNQTSNGLLYTCHFEAYIRQEIFNLSISEYEINYRRLPLSLQIDSTSLMPSTGYIPIASEYDNCLPTLNDTGIDSYTHKRLQGQVSDGDCYAMGGICGHAGVFSTGPDIARLLTVLLNIYNGVKKEENNEWNFLNSTTLQLFTAEFNQTQSSRALGWTINDPSVKDYGFDNSCGTMSTLTFMHTGYSGTIVCIDPIKGLWSTILTNRVYNCQGQLCPSGSSDPVKAIYKEFNTVFSDSMCDY
jgi:CubicO group peptidase (beta-lactamase class C family)